MSSTQKTPASNPEPYFVGELGSKWSFPSDHLPIGASIEQIHIAFWNVLHTASLHYIESNAQGLRDCQIITKKNPVRAGSLLTEREEYVLQEIMNMVNHDTHPRSLIGLQEINENVLNELYLRLPLAWAITTPSNQPNSEDIFIYNTQVFDFISSADTRYRLDDPRTIFTLTLQQKSSNELFRIVQSHIPGGPIKSGPGCKTFAQEALKQYDPELTTLLMGDMNQPTFVLEKYLEKEAEKKGIHQPFQPLLISYPTHINTLKQASWIDNFFIYNPLNKQIEISNPGDLTSLVESTAQLLIHSASHNPLG